MSATERQTDLFAGEMWDAIYRAFPSVNFNASDPVSINQALQEYIRLSFPEKFNDWTVSDEFVAIIDLLSWLAGTLAFKTDLAARENFLDTAEAKESVLRLARFLSYNPSRCQTSSGILKITAISTDNNVYDSFGSNLINTTVTWNDVNNPNWFDQFTSILNDAFVTTNPFGVPLSQGLVTSVQTQLYRINGLTSDSSRSFSSNVSGVDMDFELCDGDFTDGGTLFERDPNILNALQLYYLNDNRGFSSTRTGFFFLFKQGSTQTQTFNIGVPVENQLIDLGRANVNQTDVWVDTVNDAGEVLVDWIKVPAIFNSNVTYNAVPINQRNIYSVVTRTNDQITIRFSDGRFGNAPTGNIQVTYRVSNGLTYQIQPMEIDNIQLPISYVDPTTGAKQILTVTFSLFESIANSSSSETIESIRQRAPRVYGTQGRMVSGEDYNAFPLSTNLAVKINAVNRVYSGQSRYIDLHDPTGTFQDLSIFSEDGIFFRDTSDNYFEVPISLNRTSAQIVSGYIQPTLAQYTVSNMIRDVLLQNTKYVTSMTPAITWSNGTIDVSGLAITWSTSNANLFQTTGWFSQRHSLMQPGALVQFMINNAPTWVAIVDIQGNANAVPLPDTAGPVTLAEEVPTGTLVLAILPSATILPDADVLTAMITQMNLKLSFSLWYDYSNASASTGPIWVMNAAANDFGQSEAALVGTQLQIMNVSYVTAIWRITARGLRYVFESIRDVQWFDNGNRALAQATGEGDLDLVRVMRINRDLNDARGYALPKDYNLTLDRLWLYEDGTEETRRSTVTLYDGNGNGYPDLPDTYYKLVSNTAHNSYLFWSNAANPPYDVPIYNMIVYDTDALMQADTGRAFGTVAFMVKSNANYLSDETFWVFGGDGWQQDVNSVYRMERGRGPNVAASWVTASDTSAPSGDEIVFHWKHYAPSDHRIDPCTTNIIDIFVLTYAYDNAIRRWITNGADVSLIPAPPSELDLSIAFSALEQYKMFSDSIIWRPVAYKFLFGNGAAPELAGQFKVVRLVNSAVSDGQIQSGVINAVNAFFAVSNWDFGETFYFTELAAYIHQQLVGLISSVVLVPTAAEASFGNNFEITCAPDEIFISTATVANVVVIKSNTAVNLRITQSPLT